MATPQHRFDRLLFVELEAAEGTAETIAVGDFVECLDDVTFSMEPFSVERNLVRPAFTKIPDYYASDGITSSDSIVSMCTITANVELTALTGGPTTGDPGYSDLMLACGFVQIAGVERETISGGSVTGGPFFHREQCTSESFQVVGTTFTGDPHLYYNGTDPVTASCTGDISLAAATITTAATAAGIAYSVDTDAGYGDSSSVTIELNVDGRRITAKGCRGNVSWAFNSLDRVIMTFTMQGIVHNIDDAGANRSGISYGHQLPPTFVSAGLLIKEATGTTDWSGALFNQMVLNMGNEIIMREDANSASGWKAAQIAGRAPTITMNPDAIEGGATSATVYDYFEEWTTGTLARMSFEVGDNLDNNSFLFKAPAVQWTGIADGDRDNYSILDCSGSLTGGSIGDSVVHDATGSTQLHADKGAENELVIIMT